jgi:dihydroflavonol-4-reductase
VVRAVVRPASDAAPLRALGVETFPGDVTDRVSLREGMSGSDWVVHLAAELDLGAPRARMEAVNVLGSENVASLAWKLGVGRLLGASSIAAWGGSPDDGTPATEETPRRAQLPTLYGETKLAGERAARAWAEKGLRLNVVYPSLVYGPPGKRGGANGLLRGLARGRYPALIGADKRTSWVYLEDVVDGMLRVVERAPAGRDYLLAGDVATVREVAQRVAALAGVKPPRVDVPIWAARAALGVAAPLSRLRGRKLPFPPAQLASMARHWAFDDGRARRELEWAPRGLEVGLPPTVEYLQGGRNGTSRGAG